MERAIEERERRRMREREIETENTRKREKRRERERERERERGRVWQRSVLVFFVASYHTSLNGPVLFVFVVVFFVSARSDMLQSNFITPKPRLTKKKKKAYWQREKKICLKKNGISEKKKKLMLDR